MKVTLKRDSSNNILVWVGSPDNTNNETADLVLQTVNDIKAIREEIGEMTYHEVVNGWIVRDVEIDDMWVGV